MDNSLKGDIDILKITLKRILDKVVDLNMWGEKEFDIYCEDPLDDITHSSKYSDHDAARLTYAIGNALDFVRELIKCHPSKYADINMARSFGLAEKIYEAAKDKYIIGRNKCRCSMK